MPVRNSSGTAICTVVQGGAISFIIIVQMTFHWKGWTMTGHSIGRGGTMVIPPTRFRLAAYKILVSFISWPAGPGLIFKQTLTGSVSKWMTRNRYPVDTCTPQLASRVICIYVFAPCVRFYSRDFRRRTCSFSPAMLPSCFLPELLHICNPN